MSKIRVILGGGLAAAMVSAMVPAQSIGAAFSPGHVKQSPFSGLNKEEFLSMQASYFDQADENRDGILTHREKGLLAAKVNQSIPREVWHDMNNSLRALRGERPLPPIVEDVRGYRFDLESVPSRDLANFAAR